MWSKIGNSLILAFCGLFLGALLGFFLYASFHFVRYFPFYSLGIFGIVFLINLIKINNTSNRSKILGLIFSTLFAGVILCGMAGSGWLMAGESVEFEFSDTIILAILLFFSTFGVAILIPIRMVWHDTYLGKWVEQNLRGIKVLLGMSGKSEQ